MKKEFKVMFCKITDRHDWLAHVLRGIAGVIPDHGKLKRYRNFLVSYAASMRGLSIIGGNPVTVRIAPVSTCNYRCLFCEIHKDDVLYPKRSSNQMTMENFLNYEEALKSAWNLAFFGGTEEPLLSKDIRPLTEYLKKNYGTYLFVNTNASMLTEPTVETFVKHGFDSILVSYHAGTKEGYKTLMTGNIDKVDNWLRLLRDYKKKLKKARPRVSFNFALQKINAGEARVILDKARELGAESVYVNRYYGGRNKLQDQEVSFEYDPEAGNKALEEIYAYAKDIGMPLFPKESRFWELEKKEVIENPAWDHNNWDKGLKCRRPWTALHFNPALDAKDSHYIGVCNRVELFKIDYSRASLKTRKDFQRLWNHPLLQYLRKTVNCKNAANPICRFCKNHDREWLRNVNADKYAELRDQAIDAFFKEARETMGEMPEFDGFHVLNSNPDADYKYKDILREKFGGKGGKLKTAAEPEIDEKIKF